ncbi:MAG: hypothetical protein DRO15_04205 [Thermoprotei archaeon]|nr:MAG: hypothetical protein DRO15_04205 [Thermoprotei archaeon]
MNLKLIENNYRWIILILIGFAYIMFSAYQYSISPALSFIGRDLGLSHAELMSLMTAFMIGYGSFQIVSGVLSLIIGAKRAYIAALSIEALATYVLSLSIGFLDAFIYRFISGLGAGLFIGASTAVLVQWFKESELGFAIGIAAGTCFGIGIALAESSVILVEILNWRNYLVLISIIGLAIALVNAAFVRYRMVEISKDAWVRLKLGLLRVMRHRSIWLISLASIGAYGTAVAFLTMLPTYLTDFCEWDPGTASIASSILGLGFIPFGPLAGIIADKLGRRKPIIILGSILCGICYLMLLTQITSLVWISVVIFPLAINMVLINLLAIVSEYPEIGVEFSSAAVGLAMEIVILGSMWIPWLAGMILDISIATVGIVPEAYTNVWISLSALTLLALIALPAKDVIKYK